MKIRLARKIAHTPIDRLNPYWLDAAVFRGGRDNRINVAIKKSRKYEQRRVYSNQRTA